MSTSIKIGVLTPSVSQQFDSLKNAYHC